MVMMIVHSDAVDPSRPMLVRGLETSEGSIPSIGLGRVHSWTPYNFCYIFLLLSTRPDSWPVLAQTEWCKSTRWSLLTIKLERPSYLVFLRRGAEQLPYFSKVDRDYYGY